MNLHKFTTVEMLSAAYCTAKARLVTLADTTSKRAALFARDRTIARELPKGWVPLAERYGISKSAVYLAAKRGRAG